MSLYFTLQRVLLFLGEGHSFLGNLRSKVENILYFRVYFHCREDFKLAEGIHLFEMIVINMDISERMDILPTSSPQTCATIMVSRA